MLAIQAGAADMCSDVRAYSCDCSSVLALTHWNLTLNCVDKTPEPIRTMSSIIITAISNIKSVHRVGWIKAQYAASVTDIHSSVTAVH